MSTAAPWKSIAGWEDWERIDGWDAGAPGVRFPHDDHPEAWDIDADVVPKFDHTYRLRQGRKTIYVTEPYGLDGADYRKMAALVDDGWTILVRADLARWYPGHTVAVLMCRGKGWKIP